MLGYDAFLVRYCENVRSLVHMGAFLMFSYRGETYTVQTVYPQDHFMGTIAKETSSGQEKSFFFSPFQVSFIIAFPDPSQFATVPFPVNLYQ